MYYSKVGRLDCIIIVGWGVVVIYNASVQFIGWMIDCPYVLVIIVLVGWGTIATWRLLTTMTTPSILTSPKTSLMLLLGLSMVVMRGYNTNQKLLALQNDIDDANWIIRQGGQHRLDLLNQIERQGLGRPKVENQVEEERKGWFICRINPEQNIAYILFKPTLWMAVCTCS